MSTEEIFNYRYIDAGLILAGQPDEAQLHAAAGEGFQVVINLAPHSSSNALNDEAGLCHSLGLDYHNIPVDWSNPASEDYATFVAVLDQARQKKVLIHCAANYRVTAFFSTYAMQKLGWSSQQADSLINSIWEQDPRWLMNDVWSTFIQKIRTPIE